MTSAPGVPPLRPTALRALFALMKLTLQETFGERVVHLSFALAVVLAALLLSCSELAIFAHERVIVDGTLTAMTVVPLLLSVATALQMMERDLGERSPSVLLAQPISLALWLGGRFLGLWLTMVTLVLAMALVLLPLGALLGAPSSSYLWAAALVPWECTIALSIAMAARCLSQRNVAWAITLVLLAAGYTTLAPQDMRNKVRAPAMPVYRALQAAVPQLQRINLRTEASRNSAPEARFVVAAVVYAVGYSGAALVLGAWVLQRRRGA